MLSIERPYLLFLGNSADALAPKTSRGIAEWRPDLCVGEYGDPLTLGLPKMSPAQAAAAGAKTFVVGLANAGGKVAPEWLPAILEAIDAGMDVASGLHQKLSDNDTIREAANRRGVSLHDVRHDIGELWVGTGARRSGKRILTVGTDCSVGKMYTSLAIERELKSRNYKVDFRATGQTGILIAGEGIPVDAIVSDFISGAVEQLACENDDDHWDIVEGQGSLFHPAFAGVSLGLLHGAQPDVLVMCHEAGRTRIKDNADYAVSSLRDCVDTNLAMSRLTSPDVALGAISLNCRTVDPDKVDTICRAVSEEFCLPCFDPMIHGAAAFADWLENRST